MKALNLALTKTAVKVECTVHRRLTKILKEFFSQEFRLNGFGVASNAER